MTKIDAETIDRLLLDRQLGTLSADAATLLEAYIESDEQATRLADEYSRTLMTARRVLCQSMPVGRRSESGRESLPPHLRRRLQKDSVLRGPFRLMRSISAAAALVVVSVGLSAMWFSSRENGVGDAIAQRNTLNKTTAGTGDAQPAYTASTENGGFWSERRLLERAAQDRPRPSGWRWQSPTQWPQLGVRT